MDSAGAHFFNLVVALGKRMKYGCEPATQRYLAASILSLCDKNTISKLENHMLLHKLVETVAKLPSFASKADGFALNCIISSLWCLAKSPVCCRILSETTITPSLMKIMIELNAQEPSSLTIENKNTRKRIVGLFFLMTSTNTTARHAILAEDYGHEVIGQKIPTTIDMDLCNVLGCILCITKTGRRTTTFWYIADTSPYCQQAPGRV